MQTPSELQPSPSAADESPLDAIQRAAAEGYIDRFEELWMETLEAGEPEASSLDQLLDAAEVFARRADGKETLRSRLGALFELLLSVTGESTAAPAMLRIHQLLLTAFPQKRDRLSAFTECFEAVHPAVSAERAFYEACGFPSCLDPAASLRRLERLVRFRDGAYVLHGSGWGMGRVLSVDPFLRQVQVDLEHKKGHRIAIDAVDSILEPLDPESYTVLLFEKSAKLEDLRDNDPVRLVTLVLDSCGNPLPTKELRASLTPDVVPTAGWTKWWTRAKGLLRKTGFFRIGDRSPYLVERVEAEISYARDMLKQFLDSDWPVAKKLARQASRKSTGELAEAWTGMREALGARARGSDPSAALEAAVMLQRGDADEGTLLDEVVQRLSAAELTQAAQGLTAAEELRRVVEVVSAHRQEDAQDILLLFVRGKNDTVRDVALDQLEADDPEAALREVQAVLRNPHLAPSAFCHFVKVAAKAKVQRLALAPFRDAGEDEILTTGLDLLDHLRHRSMRDSTGMKDILGRVCGLLEDQAFFLRAITPMKTAKRREAHARILESHVIPNELKAILIVALVRLDPNLRAAEEDRAFWEDEESIYVTAEGLERRREEFREITEVKLPENFKAIGRAREFGDLSENAEYTSALEERDQLTRRATEIKAELDIAKVLDSSMVETSSVGLGSTVQLLNLTSGEEISYSILGPWDGNPEGGILSYRSPLARAILGHKAGDEFDAELPGGTESFRLVSAKSYFE